MPLPIINNLFKEYEKTFLDISYKLSNLEGCLGVVLGGSVGRGWYDNITNQDVDFYLYFNNEQYYSHLEKKGFNPNWPWVVDVDFQGLKLSIQLLNYDALEKSNPEPIIWDPDDHRWTQSNRWDKLNSRIIVDENKLINSLFKRKIVFNIEEQIELIDYFEKQIYDNFWNKLHVFELRGLIPEAQLLLSDCVDALIYVIYCKYRLFIPPEKWKFWWFRKGVINDVYSFTEIQEMYQIQKMDSLEDLRSRKNLFIDMVKKNNITISNSIMHKNTTIPKWIKRLLNK
jgi:hypothetical protein